MSAFAAAMAVLVADPNLGVEATWQRGSGPVVALRVLRASPDQLRDAFGTTLLQGIDVLTVPITVLPEVEVGDTFTLGAEVLTVGHAERDAAGVAWRVLCQR